MEAVAIKNVEEIERSSFEYVSQLECVECYGVRRGNVTRNVNAQVNGAVDGGVILLPKDGLAKLRESSSNCLKGH